MHAFSLTLGKGFYYISGAKHFVATSIKQTVFEVGMFSGWIEKWMLRLFAIYLEKCWSFVEHTQSVQFYFCNVHTKIEMRIDLNLLIQFTYGFTIYSYYITWFNFGRMLWTPGWIISFYIELNFKKIQLFFFNICN